MFVNPHSNCRSTGASTSSALAEMVVERVLQSGERRRRAKEDPIMPTPLNAGDGFVGIGRYKFRPTHPLTQTGIESLPKKVHSMEVPDN